MCVRIFYRVDGLSWKWCFLFLDWRKTFLCTFLKSSKDLLGHKLEKKISCKAAWNFQCRADWVQRVRVCIGIVKDLTANMDSGQFLDVNLMWELSFTAYLIICVSINSHCNVSLLYFRTTYAASATATLTSRQHKIIATLRIYSDAAILIYNSLLTLV